MKTATARSRKMRQTRRVWKDRIPNVLWTLLVCAVVAPSTWIVTDALSSSSPPPPPMIRKVLVLGGTGLVGTEVCRKLNQLEIPYVTASRSTGLDLTAPDAQRLVEQQVRDSGGCQAVICTIGSLWGDERDYTVNAAVAAAARGAHAAGTVQRFVSIGNDPRVRRLSQRIPALQHYARGKEHAEQAIRECFPDDASVILQPSLIYGEPSVDEAAAQLVVKKNTNVPRIPHAVGQIMEDVLGLYPFQAAADALPGILGVALVAPVSSQRVAAAAVNAALSYYTTATPPSSSRTSTRADKSSSARDVLIQAAAVRPPSAFVRRMASGKNSNNNAAATLSLSQQVRAWQQELYALGDVGQDPNKLVLANQLIDQIEQANQRQPTTDPLLNGRWDFCFDIEADLGTAVLKDTLKGHNVLLDIDDLHMVITDNRQVQIHMGVQPLRSTWLHMDLCITTRLEPNLDRTNNNAHDGVGCFHEFFESIELNGIPLPLPQDWQRSRPLEFSFLDEEMLIARGNGGEPHYLTRSSLG